MASFYVGFKVARRFMYAERLQLPNLIRQCDQGSAMVKIEIRQRLQLSKFARQRLEAIAVSQAEIRERP